MKKQSIITALFLAIGFILHSVVPGLFGMKFDLLVTFMVVAILLEPSFKNALLAGLLGGLLTALTTTFPGGQIPNIVDKLITAMTVVLIDKMITKETVKVYLAGLVGTFVSGTTFLFVALLLFGLPAPFRALMLGVVLPTSLVNSFVTLGVYKAAKTAQKATRTA